MNDRGTVPIDPGGGAVTIHTDGACSGNPGPGGWGAVLRVRQEENSEREYELSGGEEVTTNNRMELAAAIRALDALRSPARVTLFTDSTYLSNGISRWIDGWKKKGWKTAAGKPVKNVDLWKRLDKARARHHVEWQWLRGHAGHASNERADELARDGMEPYLRGK